MNTILKLGTSIGIEAHHKELERHYRARGISMHHRGHGKPK